MRCRSESSSGARKTRNASGYIIRDSALKCKKGRGLFQIGKCGILGRSVLQSPERLSLSGGGRGVLFASGKQLRPSRQARLGARSPNTAKRKRAYKTRSRKNGCCLHREQELPKARRALRKRRFLMGEYFLCPRLSPENRRLVGTSLSGSFFHRLLAPLCGSCFECKQ